MSRTPKFSVRPTPTTIEVMIESEKALTKHRLTMTDFKRRKKRELTAEISRHLKMSSGLSETGDTVETLTKLWLNYKSRLIYNEIEETVDFSQRRPTDYRHNKYIRLPKPLDPDAEFLCETKRRRFLSIFNAWEKKTTGGGSELNKKESKSTIGSNLSKVEQAGLKSLSKKIKEGDLIVAQTDKSSRMCVMTKDQYIASGLTHTKHDEEVGLNTIKTLQNRFNSI